MTELVYTPADLQALWELTPTFLRECKERQAERERLSRLHAYTRNRQRADFSAYAGQLYRARRPSRCSHRPR